MYKQVDIHPRKHKDNVNKLAKFPFMHRRYPMDDHDVILFSHYSMSIHKKSIVSGLLRNSLVSSKLHSNIRSLKFSLFDRLNTVCKIRC
jgi:hypothetical protein